MPITAREALLVGVEPSYRSAATLSAANDAVEFTEITANPIENLRMLERMVKKATFGSLPQIFAGALYLINVTVALKGSGSPGVAPRGLDPLLRAAGLFPTVDPGVSVTYNPISTGIQSISAEYYQDGSVTQILGCRTRPQFTFGVDGGLMATFDLIGHMTDGDPRDAALPTAVFDSTAALPFIGANVAFDSFAAVINELTLDVGTVLSLVPDASQSNGFGQIRVVNRDPIGSLDPEDTLVADYDWQGKFESDALVAFDTGVIGSAAGNQVRLQAGAVQQTGPTFSDREGVRARVVPVKFNETTGDDQFSLVFS